MEWILVVSMLFINGVEGQAEFQFRTEGDCRHVKEMAENYVDRYNVFGLDEFNVTCAPSNSDSIRKDNGNVELF